VSFGAKLVALFAVGVILVTALVAGSVTVFTRNAFERLDAQRTAALVAQFRREFARRGQEVEQRVDSMAGADSTQRLASEIGHAAPDYSAFVNDASDLASTYGLDFLDIIADDGTMISSAEWPARFGYKEDWLLAPAAAEPGAFLRGVDLPDGTALALESVHSVPARSRKILLVGGRKLDREFLASLVLPEGMRTLLYRYQGTGGAIVGELSQAESARLLPIFAQARTDPREQSVIVRWTSDAASEESFETIPLEGRRSEVLGMFLVGSVRRPRVELERRIRLAAIFIAAAGILGSLALSSWAGRRVTRPVERLARAAHEVAGGRWDTRVEATSTDELGQLAQAFNGMTRQLIEQRDRLTQAERVAAWRELARRLAHELKNPLFPLQITVENMVRARTEHPDQFDEVFREGAAALLAELGNLGTIIGRFSDFAKMPAPELQAVNLDEVIRRAARLSEAQIQAPGKPPVTLKLELAAGGEIIQADPELLHRAIQNLLMNALDAMPEGGTLLVRSAPAPGGVTVEVSDTGIGLTPEERDRLFTPYYTSKQHGTGLGLAIVQSIVSDHGGRIRVESEPERGTTFRIELPASPASGPSAAGPAKPRVTPA
jgi:signal transduction histidine kinase